jgi:hypothetical protein
MVWSSRRNNSLVKIGPQYARAKEDIMPREEGRQTTSYDPSPVRRPTDTLSSQERAKKV